MFDWLQFFRPTPPFSGGVLLDMHKITDASPIADCPLPEVLIHPLKQHIGASCELLVSVGDHVFRGQKIGKSKGYVSAPVHAGTSGKVVRIEDHIVPHPSGLGMPCIFIEADGLDQSIEAKNSITDWINHAPSLLREQVRLAGITGLGGAGFPTYIKLLKDQRHPIHTVVLNGIECEPWLTHDHRLMIEHSDAIVEGLAILLHLVGSPRGVIAIEDNKPIAILAMQQAIDAYTSNAKNQAAIIMVVQSLPTRYPQGSEKQLIQAITGQEVPAGKLPMHTGVLCQNIASTEAIYRAIVQGKPLTERVITVSGDALPIPANLRVRLGTPMRFVFSHCGLRQWDGIQIVHGGPMMGERLKNAEAPVVKSTTGLLAMARNTLMAEHQGEEPCIRCGHCSEVCPIHLVPNMLADFTRQEQFDKAESYQLFDCIECGCCSHVCPSHIPLVHYFRYGKGQLAQIRKEKSFAEASRQRSEQRNSRIVQEKAAKAARRSRVRQQAKKILPPETKDDQP
ncbi:MAG: electron transport complex subunit RsxC [Mariprofundaceae bacterium]|nr:electron transport complex subunit RsxC [Mariprofundaceae bacterium]